MWVPNSIETYHKSCGMIPQVYCKVCQQHNNFLKMLIKTTGKVLFVQIISVTNMAYFKCSSCGTTYTVDKKGFDKVVTATDVYHAIQDVENKQKEVSETYKNAGFSKKNQVLAIFFFVFFTTLGVPFFYVGKPLWGLLCIAISFIGTSFRIFPLLFGVVFGGWIFAFLLWKAKIKDGSGKYIVSKKQKEGLTESNF